MRLAITLLHYSFSSHRHLYQKLHPSKCSYFKAHFNLSNTVTIVTYGVQYMPGCGLVQKARNTFALAARLLAVAAGNAVSVVHWRPSCPPLLGSHSIQVCWWWRMATAVQKFPARLGKDITWYPTLVKLSEYTSNSYKKCMVSITNLLHRCCMGSRSYTSCMSYLFP